MRINDPEHNRRVYGDHYDPPADLSAMLADLKTKADKATPGPWEPYGPKYPHAVKMPQGGYAEADAPADAAFIAAADPQVVAALAKVVQAVEAQRGRLGLALGADVLGALADLEAALAGKENSDERG